MSILPGQGAAAAVGPTAQWAQVPDPWVHRRSEGEVQLLQGLLDHRGLLLYIWLSRRFPSSNISRHLEDTGPALWQQTAVTQKEPRGGAAAAAATAEALAGRR